MHDESYGERRGSDRQQAMRLLGRAVTTLMVTPPHLRLYRDLKDEALVARATVPIHPPIAEEMQKVASQLNPRMLTRDAPISSSELTMTASLLMQFGNHFHAIPASLQVSYPTISELHGSFIDESQSRGRLSLSDQLAIALDQSNGALRDSLYNLCIASRMYARWLDEKTITALPELSVSDRKDRMRVWQDTLLGFKTGDDAYHDTAGDTYYAWTHAYAGYMFESLPRRKFIQDKLAQTAFRHGTYIMQTFVNNLNPRGVISDHTVAARYGNATADTLNHEMN